MTRLYGVPEYTGEAFHSFEPIKSFSFDAFLPSSHIETEADEEEENIDMFGADTGCMEYSSSAVGVGVGVGVVAADSPHTTTSSSSLSKTSSFSSDSLVDDAYSTNSSSKSMRSRDSCSSLEDGDEHKSATSSTKSKKASFAVSFNHMVQVCFVPSRKDIGPSIKELYWRGEDYEQFKQEAIVEIRAFWKFVGSSAKYTITALYQPEYNWPESFTDHMDHSPADMTMMSADKLIITGTSPGIPSPMLEMNPPPSMSQLKHVDEMVGIIDEYTGEVAVVVEGTMMKHVDSLSRLHYLDDSCFDTSPHSRTSSDCSGCTTDSEFSFPNQSTSFPSPDKDSFVSAKYSWLDNESDADSIVSDSMDYAL